MAENNEQMNPAQNGGDAPAGEHKRRRGHRGGRNHKRHREGAVPAEGVAENTAPVAEKASEPKGDKKKNDKRQEQKPNAKKEKNGDDRQGGQKNDRQGGRGKRSQGKKSGWRPDHVSQKDDIYGDPREEKELAEWRAKIVLNAEPVTPPAPVEEPTPAESVAEEPVEISEGTDLFASPILTPISDESVKRIEVIGVRFRSSSKTYYFDPLKTKIATGTFVIVETARGPEFGEVTLANAMVKESETVTPLRPLIRIATEADIAHNEENKRKECDAMTICARKIAEHGLEMKLIEAQYAFDNSKLLFYFSSEGRVDFRDLVKDLASVFRTRIELRQIGIRDEAKLLGGFGACGRILCCSSFLPDFTQVTIKMAKEQGLSLNATKISGTCGKLMCCLRFESDVYAEETKRTPAQGSLVKTEDGVGTVISTNPLAGTVRVVLRDEPDTPPKQYHRDTLTVLPKEKPHADAQGKDRSREKEKNDSEG